MSRQLGDVETFQVLGEKRQRLPGFVQVNKHQIIWEHFDVLTWIMILKAT